MKRLLALLTWAVLCLCRGAVLPARGAAPNVVVRSARHVTFLAASVRDSGHSSGVQPWLYNPPPAALPRSKPLEMPGDPLVLPPVDNLWGMQPSASPPTIAPPEKQGDVGLQATIPPKSLDGWYNTIPPQMIEDGLIDDRTAYYVRCLGGPAPCPFTVPPAMLRYWVPVSQMALAKAQASTTLSENVEKGAMVLPVTAMAGFLPGRMIIINAGTPVQEVNFVAGFGSILLKQPLLYSHMKGILITMPMPVMTTPAPMTMPPFMPWANFQPFMPFTLFGPGPGPAPGPFPGPAPAPMVFGLSPLPFPGPAPSPGGAPGPGPGPAPAPVR